VFGVKIFKPGKDGLELKETISAKRCSEIHWSGAKGDPLRSGVDKKTGIKFHRIGISKKCAEHKFGCKNMIDDNRKSLCSESCRRKRLARQRFHSKQNQVKREERERKKREPFLCVICTAPFKQSRSDHVFCSRKCRNDCTNNRRKRIDVKDNAIYGAVKPRASKYA
jgi:hypothetical protein